MAPSKTFIPSEYIRTYVCVPKLLYENLTSQEGERNENPEFKDSSKDLLYENARRTNIGLDRIRRQNEERKDGEAENDEEEKEKEEEKLGFDQKIKEIQTQAQLKSMFYEKIDDIATPKTKTSLKSLADRLLSDPSLVLKAKGVKAGPYKFSYINFFDLLFSSVNGKKVGYLKNERKYIDYLVRTKIPTSLIVNRFMRSKVEERRTSGDKDLVQSSDDDDDDDDDDIDDDSGASYSDQSLNGTDLTNSIPHELIDKASHSAQNSWFTSVSHAKKTARNIKKGLLDETVFARHDDD